jgi:2-C-methyl-D-erythritol 4-phosphate cytidylyltransferase
MKKTAIIVAGGAGIRMKHDIPKQFLQLHGLPLLMHTITCFYTWDHNLDLIVALPERYRDYWKDLCGEHGFEIKHVVVNGGLTRFDTVKNSLAAASHEGIIAIHDGVRPLVSHATLERCFSMAAEKGSAIPCIPVSESLRVEEDDHSYPVDRTQYRLIQTPQVFRWEIIKKAYDQEYLPEFTDDASVVEKAGFPIYLVEGNPENIKITSPADLLMAAALMEGGEEGNRYSVIGIR